MDCDNEFDNLKDQLFALESPEQLSRSDVQ